MMNRPPFDEHADRYAQWFSADNLTYQIELAALRSLETVLPEPFCEIGVGPGFFARDLHIGLGIDPAFGALRKARENNIAVCLGTGEFLPLQTAGIGTIFLLFTFCFLQNPRKTLREIRRTLQPGGKLVLGMIPAGSPWGKAIQKKKEQKDLFYYSATLYDPINVMALLSKNNFIVDELRSVLRQPPELVKKMEKSAIGVSPEAGFVIIVASPG